MSPLMIYNLYMSLYTASALKEIAGCNISDVTDSNPSVTDTNLSTGKELKELNS